MGEAEADAADTTAEAEAEPHAPPGRTAETARTVRAAAEVNYRA